MRELLHNSRHACSGFSSLCEVVDEVWFRVVRVGVGLLVYSGFGVTETGFRGQSRFMALLDCPRAMYKDGYFCKLEAVVWTLPAPEIPAWNLPGTCLESSLAKTTLLSPFEQNKFGPRFLVLMPM